jgi:hypothetical protein
MHGFMIDAVTGDTIGKLEFRRLVVFVSGCIAEHTDGYLLLQRSAIDGAWLQGLEMIMSIILIDQGRANEMGRWLGKMEDFALAACCWSSSLVCFYILICF